MQDSDAIHVVSHYFFMSIIIIYVHGLDEPQYPTRDRADEHRSEQQGIYPGLDDMAISFCR